jgi:hypothetical protein
MRVRACHAASVAPPLHRAVDQLADLGMPQGPAGAPCVQLDDELRCSAGGAAGVPVAAALGRNVPTCRRRHCAGWADWTG